MVQNQPLQAFETRIPGKWVLAGEHAVLRGATAIALPHPQFSLKLSFDPNASASLDVQPAEAGAVVRELLGSVRESLLRSPGRDFPDLHGRLRIDSSIPVGAGLGSSAALCVGLTRWLAETLGMALDLSPQNRDQMIAFARQMEHRFHGKSSGMDVAAASLGEAIAFSMENGPRPLGIRRLPKFTFHDTGLRSRTSDCVAKVEGFRSDSPSHAGQIDASMSSASQQIQSGLLEYDRTASAAGLDQIAQGIRQAQDCFREWRLVPAEVAHLEKDLLAQGALAAKLTGAGAGGFMVALWRE